MGNVQTAVRAYDQPWRPASGDLVELGRTLRLPLGKLRLQRTPVSGLKRRDTLALGLLVLALHGAAAYWISQAPTPVLPVVPPQIPPMTIEFAAPAPPAVEPPHRLRRRRWSSRHPPQWWMSWRLSLRQNQYPSPSRNLRPSLWPSRSPSPSRRRPRHPWQLPRPWLHRHR